MIQYAILVSMAVAFVLSFVGTLLAKRLAFRVGMLDEPGGHKGHGKATPLLGGPAIFLAILLPSAAALIMCKIWAAGGPDWLPAEIAAHLSGAASRLPQAIGILLAAAGLCVLGLIDDKRHLGPWLKLLVQIAAAAWVVCFCDVRVLTVAGPAVSCIVSILWLVGITNSFNFLDNMDGLAVGVAAICAGALLSAAGVMNQWFVMAWASLILGATLGFLPHNFPPAKIFMGDAGSLMLGFLLGVVSCLTTYVRPSQATILYGILVPLFVMAVPIYDTASVFWIRISEGRNPMVGDRRHFSHRLLRRGMSKRRAALTIYLCTACTALAACLMPHVSGIMPALMLLGLVAAVLMVVALLEATENRAV
ncbi:MAG: undecaprenyl/decaprenyl-phosphate alpha-N-acetylglucosaminyl 1-phosphate transferase [Phycisphaerae bacterium]|nr:undecaprenyl/decaprenyl-phosphate alpha-N-acetylglucosaminyl 1-phosphate transferase [Phycisphaerae bacterium]